MFKRESYKAKMREIGLLKSPTLPAYKQKSELLRPKRCHSNNPSQNKRQIITVIDNFIHKINDRRKTTNSTSDSSGSLTSSSSTESTKPTGEMRDIKTRIKDSPRLILKSTQNYIRGLKRPCQINSLKQKKEIKNDLFFDHFNSNRVEELENSSILKSLLDSQQYLMLQKSLSQSNFSKKNDDSTSSENSNSSFIVHDCSDDSDANSNQTFVEHSDESVCEQTNLFIANEPKNQTTSFQQAESYTNLLQKLDSSYLKSPNSIVNKGII